MAFNTKYIELCGINPLKSSKRTGNTFFFVVLLSKVHCTQSTLCRLCTGYFSFSCPVIFCCNNWIWNPCGGIVSSGVVSEVERYSLYIRSHEKMSILMTHKAAIRELRSGSLCPLCVMLLAKNVTVIACIVMPHSHQLLLPHSFPRWVFTIQTEGWVWVRIWL